jgi:signal transduction histidine kinase
VGQPGRSVGAGWSGKHSIRASDLVATGAVIAVVELSVAVGGGPGTGPLNARAYIIGAVISLPTLVRRRWPPRVLIATAVIMILYYLFARRNISPAPVMMLPAYETALAGYLAWAIAVPSLMMLAGVIFLSATGGMTPVDLASNFLPSVVLFVLAVALGDVLRSRRALAAETAVRLRIAEAERESEAGRRVTEERLRIARELHDTVAHSMATITVQAGSALLKEPAGPVRESLESIRRTSKDALTEMRAVLGQLRADRGSGPDGPDHGLDRLESLRDAVTAAGSPVSVSVSGDQVALPSAVDHAAYRILQESLTNVLRHAPSGTPASVCLRYQSDQLVITVDSDSGPATTATAGSGNGITGMTERAASVGGSLDAGRADSGGFRVTATLPLQEAT